MPGRDEPGNVGDVGKEQRARGPGDLAHAGEVDDAGIGAGAHRDHLRLLALRDLGQLVVVDQVIVGADAIGHDLVEFAREVGGIAVGEMPAVAQVHRQDLVAGLEDGGVDREVGLRSGVRLDVDVLGPKELFGSVDRQLLDLVDDLAPAVPAAPRVSLGILVGEDAALGLEDRRVGEVFRGDQFDMALLAAEFGGDGRGDLRDRAWRRS